MWPHLHQSLKSEAAYEPLNLTTREGMQSPFLLKKAPDLKLPEIERRHIFIYVNVFCLSGIDTVGQQFDSHFFIRASWVEPGTNESTKIDYESCWQPALMFMNAVGTVEIVDETIRVCDWRSGKSGELVMEWRADCRGTFRQAMELKRFPFDCQILTIMLTSKHNAGLVTLSEDIWNDSKSLLRNQFTVLSEFDMSGPHMHCSTDDELGKYTFLHISFTSERRFAYYMWNIALPVFLITGLVFSVFAMPPEDLADRLSITLTLVLTAVAFKYMVAQDLPRIPYLTVIDTYVLVSFAFLASIGLQNVLAALLVESWPEFEEHSRNTLAISFLTFHVCMTALSISCAQSEHQKVLDHLEGLPDSSSSE